MLIKGNQMAKKKEAEQKEVEQPIMWVRGAFVLGHRVIQKQIGDLFLIKLSTINMVVPLERADECLFYTYKDCCYWAGISVAGLRRAIDSFIFKPEEHWESYGY